MQFTILAAKQVEDIIFTEVVITFDDATTTQVSIPHFRPATKDDVLQGIVNRVASENNKKDSASVGKDVLAELPLNTPIEV